MLVFPPLGHIIRSPIGFLCVQDFGSTTVASVCRFENQAVENVEVVYPDRIFQLKSEHA